jgi:dihydrofolate synthase/folylpolyglutamate synthase
MTDLEQYLDTLQRFGIRPGLERIAALLERAGRPDREYPIVLVGGTNGKGSTCEYLAQMLTAAGCKTGLYTSPHLYRWNERIRVLDSAPKPELFPGIISDEALDELFLAARPHLDAVAAALGQPTEFETLTFLALWHFARERVNAAVVEVGLGGRWDATNATDPLVSVITRVALDHCDRLGNTLEAIARDKVQIARRGRTLVTAEEKPNVLQVLRAECEIIGARLLRVDAEYSAPSELPAFQQTNLATATAAYEVLSRELPLRNFPSPIRNPPWNVPGRLEILRTRPTLLLDGANNPDGAAQLARELNAHFLTGDARLLLVLGASADNDLAGMVDALAPLAYRVFTTQADHPRAAPAQTIADEVARWKKPVEAIAPVPAAVARALDAARATDVVCVTGSFFVLAEVERGK